MQTMSHLKEFKVHFFASNVHEDNMPRLHPPRTMKSCWFPSLPLLPPTQIRAQFKLAIAHVNDHHSRVADGSFAICDIPPCVTLPDAPHGQDPHDRITVKHGGSPRLVTLHKLFDANDLLTLHAGDATAKANQNTLGNICCKVSRSKVDAEMTNFACFDATTLGNHEFDFGDTALAEFIALLQNSACATPTTVLSAKFVSEVSPVLSLTESSVTWTFGDERVGVISISITTQNTKNFSMADERTSFSDTVAVVETEIAALVVNKIVLLSHIESQKNVCKLASIPGVDVTVEGHSHLLLGKPIVATNPGESSPRKVCDAWIVQAWEHGHVWGLLEIDFDAAGLVGNCTGGPKFPIDGVTCVPDFVPKSTVALTTFLEETDAKVVAFAASVVTARTGGVAAPVCQSVAAVAEGEGKMFSFRVHLSGGGGWLLCACGGWFSTMWWSAGRVCGLVWWCWGCETVLIAAVADFRTTLHPSLALAFLVVVVGGWLSLVANLVVCCPQCFFLFCKFSAFHPHVCKRPLVTSHATAHPTLAHGCCYYPPLFVKAYCGPAGHRNLCVCSEAASSDIVIIILFCE